MKHTNAVTRKKAMNRVQILLKSVMLRRQKTSVVDGEQICTIPPKHTKLANVEFSDDEFAVYKALEQKSRIQFNKFVDRGAVAGKLSTACRLLFSSMSH